MPLRQGMRRELRSQLRSKQTPPPAEAVQAPSAGLGAESEEAAATSRARRRCNAKGQRSNRSASRSSSAPQEARGGHDEVTTNGAEGGLPSTTDAGTSAVTAVTTLPPPAPPRRPYRPTPPPAASSDRDAALPSEALVIGSAAHRQLLKATIRAATGGAVATAGAATSAGMGAPTASVESHESPPDGASSEPPAIRNRFLPIERGASSFTDDLAAGGCGNGGGAGGGGATATTQAAQVARKKQTATRQMYEHLLVLDFEATCDRNDNDWEHEIIEFPITVVHTGTKKVVAEFHSFVRPVKNPKLTPFCTELTGITQAQVNAAPTLPEVLLQVRLWLRSLFPEAANAAATAAAAAAAAVSMSTSSPTKHVDPAGPPPSLPPLDPSGGQVDPADPLDAAFSDFLLRNCIACFATDGPWDMRRFMLSCSVLRDGIPFPKLFYHYINIRKSYANFFKTKPLTLSQMLIRQGLQFAGNLHSGRDDTRNIARIAVLLMDRGCVLKHVSSLPVPDEAGMLVAREVEALLAEFREEDVRLKARITSRVAGGGGGGGGGVRRPSSKPPKMGRPATSGESASSGGGGRGRGGRGRGGRGRGGK